MESREGTCAASNQPALLFFIDRFNIDEVRIKSDNEDSCALA